MAKHAQPKENVLDLSGNPNGTTWGSSLVPYRRMSQDKTRDERKIEEEYNKQNLVIEKHGEKAKFGISTLMDVHRHLVRTFYDTTEFIFLTKAEAQGQEFQPYIDQFAHQLTQVSAHHGMAVAEAAAHNIGNEVLRPLYMTAPPQGFMQRLFRIE